MKKNIQLFNFSGFYNSIHSIELDEEDEELDDKINYKAFEKAYSKEYIEYLNFIFKEKLEKIWISNIKFHHLYSPEYYNYWNDEIYIDIDFNKKKLIKYLNKNKEKISKYIEKFNITTDIKKYISECDKENIISQILKYYIDKEDEEFEINSYYYIEWYSLIYQFIE